MSTTHDGTTARFTDWLATFRRAVVHRFTAVDVVTLLYIAIATAAVLAFSGHDHAGWNLLLTAHALILVLVLIAPALVYALFVGRTRVRDGPARWDGSWATGTRCCSWAGCTPRSAF